MSNNVTVKRKALDEMWKYSDGLILFIYKNEPNHFIKQPWLLQITNTLVLTSCIIIALGQKYNVSEKKTIITNSETATT